MNQDDNLQEGLVVEMEILADKYYQNDLSDHEQSRLLSILAEHPEIQQKYVDYMHDTYYLNHVANSDFTVSGEPENENGSSPKSSTVLSFLSNCTSQVTKYMTEPTPLSIAIAFLVIVGGLITLQQVYYSPEKEPVITTGDDNQPRRPIRVAKIIQVDDVEWKNDKSTLNVGQHLNDGQKIEILSGSLELVFGDGSVALVQGPAIFETLASNRAFLTSGKLTARATKGFIVSTPTTKVVDLGTVFGMTVDGNDETYIAVLDGEVRVISRLKAMPFEPFQLTTNQTARIIAGTSQPKLSRIKPLKEKTFADGIYRLLGDVIEVDFNDATGHQDKIPSSQYSNLKMTSAAWVQNERFHDGNGGLGLASETNDRGKNPWSHPIASDPIIIEFDQPVRWVSVDAFGAGVNGAQIQAFDANGKVVDTNQVVNQPRIIKKKIKQPQIINTLSIHGTGIKRIELIQHLFKLEAGDGVGWDNVRYIKEQKSESTK